MRSLNELFKQYQAGGGISDFPEFRTRMLAKQKEALLEAGKDVDEKKNMKSGKFRKGLRKDLRAKFST